MQIKLADYLDNALPVLLKAIHFLGLYHSKISQSRRRIVPAFSMPPNSISYAAVGAKRTAKIKPASHRESSQFWPRKFCFGNNKNRRVALRASRLMKRDILLVANGDADSNAIIAESPLEFGLRLSRRFQAPSKQQRRQSRQRFRLVFCSL
jgi:hypothetical protein